jgi:hypothetical protein
MGSSGYLATNQKFAEGTQKGWDKNYCSQIMVLLWHLIWRVEENNDNPQSSEPMLYASFKFSTV